ncbi:DUF4326 domain-containing protein [Euryhalocaulis caribicus]|uniref:DUF4326 domain-containing protein n=1 Tax=Euryhalocaulis caribicus TaxID=1161401 RepID=UPI0003A50AE5|nr:DUF4326 domain-containing protein [Euryhalocaulis caribicus]
MTGPRRIQLSRKKGWRLPEGAVSVARPHAFSNPYRIGNPHPKTGAAMTREDVIALFRERALAPTAGFLYRENVRRELAGKDLACWCPLDQPCHADVLLEIANGAKDGET